MMNLHFFIYIKHPERFSRAGFEAYCREFGLQVTVPEDFSLTDPPVNNLFFMLIDDPDFTKGQEDGVCRLNIVVDPGAAVVSPEAAVVSLAGASPPQDAAEAASMAIRRRDAMESACFFIGNPPYILR